MLDEGHEEDPVVSTRSAGPVLVSSLKKPMAALENYNNGINFSV